jgi:hypothetical protein
VQPKEHEPLLFDCWAKNSGDKIDTRSFRLLGLGFLSGYDAVLIGLNRFRICVSVSSAPSLTSAWVT